MKGSERNMNSSKKSSFLNYFSMILLSIFILLCWVSHDFYNKFVPYASPFMSLFLCTLFFANINLWEQLKKKELELYLIIGGVLLAGINMLLIKSNWGAIFSIGNTFLFLYLADKIKLSKKMLSIPLITCSMVFLFWIIIKRPTFNNCDFNSNGSAFIMFALGMVSLSGWCFLLEKHSIKPRSWTIAVITLAIILGIESYQLHARGSLLGVLGFLFVYFVLPKKPWTVYLVFACSIFFPLLYILLWKSGWIPTIPVLDKRIFSGRETFWNEFFIVFSQHPITGIGSNFEYMVPKSAPYYEVHHALLNILFVHGLPVFLLMLYLWIKRLKEVFSRKSIHTGSSCLLPIGISALYGMMVIGTFENFYIAAPFNMIYFIILSMMYQID